MQVTDKKYVLAYFVFDAIQKVLKYFTPFAVGGFMLFKRGVFESLGGFNENDKFAEDYHLSTKIRPSKFYIDPDYCYTSSRRLQTKGVWYMVRLMTRCFIHRNNPEFYTVDHGYWS
jgi:hypothetical protein